MAFQMFCSRGCGHPITVTNDMLDLATKQGQPLNVSHEVCPGQDGNLRTYRVQITVTRTDDDEVLVTNGMSVDAATFADAYEALGRHLGDQWTKVGELRHIAEADLDPQSSEGGDTSDDPTTSTFVKPDQPV